MTEKLIEVKNLTVSFGEGNSAMQVIRGFNLCLMKGEVLGILGESGSGKTVSASSIMRMNEQLGTRKDSGEIHYQGHDLVKADSKEMNALRGDRIAFVFQNPTQALNPYKRVGRQLGDVLKAHGLPKSKECVMEALQEAGLDEADRIYEMYPFQLSGGQNQRVMIAQAIMTRPDLLIADEPTSSIDASLRKKVLDLFKQINKKYGTAILIITHDFDVARYLCDRLLVMYGGLVVEEGGMEAILKDPLHPYTRELIHCAQSLHSEEFPLYTLAGTPLTPAEFREECPFMARCLIHTEECLNGIPALLQHKDGRKVRCIRRETHE